MIVGALVGVKIMEADKPNEVDHEPQNTDCEESILLDDCSLIDPVD